VASVLTDFAGASTDVRLVCYGEQKDKREAAKSLLREARVYVNGNTLLALQIRIEKIRGTLRMRRVCDCVDETPSRRNATRTGRVHPKLFLFVHTLLLDLTTTQAM
jgi:hypothetical protein